MSFYPGVPQQGVGILQAAPAVSAATTAQDVTITGTKGSKIVLRAIAIYGTAAATATVVIKSGSTTILDLGTLTLAAAATVIQLYNMTFPENTNAVISVGAASAGTTTVSYIADKV